MDVDERPPGAARGRGLGPDPDLVPEPDARLAEDLRERRGEVEGGVRDRDVAAPGPLAADDPRRDDGSAARLPLHADPGRAGPGGDDAADQRHQRRARRVEAEDRRGPRPVAAGGPHEDDVVVVRERRDRRLPPVLLLRRRPVGVDPDVVEEGGVEEEPVRDLADAARRQRLGPGPEDRQRVVVVEPPGDGRVSAAGHDERPAQDPVRPDLLVDVEARPEPVLRPEAVERGRRGEELRRRGEDERRLRVDEEERALVAEPLDRDGELPLSHRGPGRHRGQARLEREVPRRGGPARAFRLLLAGRGRGRRQAEDQPERDGEEEAERSHDPNRSILPPGT